MRRLRRPAVRLAVGALVACLASNAQAACSIEHLLDLPVRLDHLQPFVDAEINGKPAQLVLDTGASTNLLSGQAARAHGLVTQASAEAGIGIDGLMRLSEATAAEVKLGGQTFQNLPFMVGGGFDRGIDGLIGQDFLADADVDYDFAGGNVRFMRDSDCGGRELVDWAGPSANVGMVVFQPEGAGARDVIGGAFINGVPIRVVFDTGGGPSMLSLAAARRVDAGPDAPGARSAGDLLGAAKRPLHTWSVPVKSFEIGGERLSNVRVRVGDWAGSGGDYADMILGGDFFRSHRVLVARSLGRVYFISNGAPTFDTEEK